ncbi:Bifunctional inhibitor/lipid-transfer protein/seed storage 2S albumin superfamily protein [Euphorbia peplus]|nr:Bifunctional inhibitor/lipid-transfer protein/seed storage 2S albumin superfamily protein [Euphorbia peplus]
MALKDELITLFLLLFFFNSVTSCPDNCQPPVPNPNCPSCPPARPPPIPHPTPSEGGGNCPRDALKLGVCVNLLNDLLSATIGSPPKTPCCSLIENLADLEAAVCLCTVIKASVLRIINLNLPVNLSLLLNYCGKTVPKGFQCA